LRCRPDLSIGFAAFHIAKGLRAAGVESLSAFDIDTATGLGEKIRAARQRRA
jgi:hypothetical protein